VSAPVVVQRRDPTGRTILSWYEDEHEAERGRPWAWVGAGELHVDEETPADISRRAIGLFRCELVQDPFQDLTWLTTHHQVEPGGCIEPNEARTP
jgi:hypothetical protein